MTKRLRGCAVGFLLLGALQIAGAVQFPTMKVELRDATPVLWEGQSVQLKICVDYGDTTSASDNIKIDGLPEEGYGISLEGGRLEPIASGRNGQAAWSAPLFLCKSGEYELNLTAMVYILWYSNPIFPQTRPYSFKANQIELDVKPLPEENRPEDFCGVVGDVRLEASLDETECEPDDVVVLHWTLRGGGVNHIKSLPSWNPGGCFKVYPPQIVSQTATEISVEQYVVALEETDGFLEPLVFSTFDPSTAQWKTISSEPFNLSVKKPTNEAQQPTLSSVPESGQRIQIGETVEASVAPGVAAQKLFRLREGDEVQVREVAAEGAWMRVGKESGVSGWVQTSVLWSASGK